MCDIKNSNRTFNFNQGCGINLANNYCLNN